MEDFEVHAFGHMMTVLGIWDIHGNFLESVYRY